MAADKDTPTKTSFSGGSLVSVLVFISSILFTCGSDGSGCEDIADLVKCYCTRTVDGVVVDCKGVLDTAPKAIPSDASSLDLSGNLLTSFEGFSIVYPHLKTLNLENIHNWINIADDAFASTPNLNWLSLARLYINMTSRALQPLTKLTGLVLEVAVFPVRSGAHGMEYDADMPPPFSFAPINITEVSFYVPQVNTLTVMSTVPNEWLRENYDEPDGIILKFDPGFQYFSKLSDLNLKFLCLQPLAKPFILDNSSFVAFQDLNVTNLHLSIQLSCAYIMEANMLQRFRSIETFVVDCEPTNPGIPPNIYKRNILEEITNALSEIRYTEITTLQLRQCAYSDRLPDSFLSMLADTNITELEMDYFGLINQEFSNIGIYIPHLQRLTIRQIYSDSILTDILQQISMLSKLQYLDLSNNKLIYSLLLLMDKTLMLPKSLEYLNISGQITESFPKILIYGIDNTKLINISGGRITVFSEELELVPFTNATVSLLFNANQCKQFYFDSVFNNKVSALYISALDLSDNELGQYIEGVAAISTLLNLENLDLSRNSIKMLRNTIFCEMQNLQKVFLSGNALREQPDALLCLRNLQGVDLSHNLFTFLEETFIEHFDQLAHNRSRDNSSFMLNLEGNPFVCSCHTLEFLRWTSKKRHDQSLVIHNLNNYQCVFDSELVSWTQNDLDALIGKLNRRCNEQTYIIIGSVSFVLVILIISAAFLIRRHRWDIKFWIINIVMKRKFERDVDVMDNNKIYDAFVSYSDEDFTWVREELVPNLEDSRDGRDLLKFCLHQRDFLPGTLIEENIVEGIKTSRKTVILLSRGFLESGWCLFELQMAHAESLDTGRDVVVPVLLDDMSNLMNHPNMSSSIRNVLRKRTYIEWPTDSRKQETFWTNLYNAIKQRPERDLSSVRRPRVPEGHIDSETQPLLGRR